MAAIASEFRRTLIGARVDKIYQPSRLELVMTMRQPGRSITIIASAQPTAARVHITETVRENPPVPPAFCMLLRKYLIGSRVREIEQLGLDRVLKITFMRSSEDVPKTLVIEVMGRHSNIALIDGDTNMILDSIKHIGADLSRVRQMGPGIQYVNPPAQDKLNILLCSEEDLDDVLGKAQENTPSMSLGRVLVSSLAGFGLGSADRVLREAGIEPAKPCRDLDAEDRRRLIDALMSLADSIRDETFLPCPSKSLDSMYSIKLGEEKFSRLKEELLAVVEANLEKCNRKLDDEDSEISKATRDLDCRKLGELILANLPSIDAGTDFAILTDYYDPDGEEIRISLDPMLSASENAQRYFKRYAKAKRVLETVVRRKEETRSELAYLEQVYTTILHADTEKDLDAIRTELVEEGYLKAAKERGRKKKKEAKDEPRLLSYAVHGYTVVVGRNNKENDFVTMKLAGPDDIWMHARGIPGAHVLVRTGRRKGEVPEEVLVTAAGIAAYYSKGRTDSGVPVDYTLRKHVRKPKGARPGMVVYSHETTIIASPRLPVSDFTR